jgi:hypothetical protein
MHFHSLLYSKATSTGLLILNQMNHPHCAVTLSTGFKSDLKLDSYPEPDESSSSCISTHYCIQKQPQQDSYPKPHESSSLCSYTQYWIQNQPHQDSYPEPHESSFLCSFLESLLRSCFLCPSFLLSAMVSHTLNVFFPLYERYVAHSYSIFDNRSTL